MCQIINLISIIRKLKTEHQLSLKTIINELKICCKDTNIIETFKQEEETIKGITKAEKIIYSDKEDQTKLSAKEKEIKAVVQI
jgi:hypothetical protein